jgi:DNA-binding SARP family transcriptional activator
LPTSDFAALLIAANGWRTALAGYLDDNARRNLRQELWRVRKAIGSQQAANGEYIQAEEFTVTFNPETDYWLDVAQLDRPVAAEHALNDLINQLALYQGELLPGFYDDWIVLERERVQALFETKMMQLMEALCREQRWSTVLEWASAGLYWAKRLSRPIARS